MLCHRLGCSFGHFGRSGSGVDSRWSFYQSRFGNDYRFNWGGSRQFRFLLQALGFTLTATHFTRVVRCAAIAGQGAGRCGFDHRSRFGNGRGCSRCGLFSLHRRLCRQGVLDRRRLSRRGWNLGCFFNHWCLDHRFRNRLLDNWLLSNYRLVLDGHACFGSGFSRLFFACRLHFDGWSCRRLHCAGGFNHWCFRSLLFSCFRSLLVGRGGSALGLLVSFGLSVGADGGAGNSGCYREAGSQVSAA